MRPLPSETANSGLASSAMVPMTSSVFASTRSRCARAVEREHAVAAAS